MDLKIKTFHCDEENAHKVNCDNTYCENLYWEKCADLGVRILANCRNDLYREYPYLDGAFASLTYRAIKEGKIGTDGEFLYFEPIFLMKMYAENPEKVRKGYLHCLLHCLYLHPFYMPKTIKEQDENFWNDACDLTVEQAMEGNGKSTERNYQMLKMQVQKETFLGDSTSFDDHIYWKVCRQGERASCIRKKWEKIAEYTLKNQKNGKQHRGSRWGSDTVEMTLAKNGKYDYRKFLRKFTISREEMELDMESFDYTFYHYGLKWYGNLPLIEPLEYKEVNRMEELVIAIDTSGSCSKEVVQRFLEETYRIFSEKENFFRKMNVHIIQCDCCIQEITVIHSEEEWKEYSKNIVIKGRAGTDFRPVFRYVKEMQNKREIKNLKALLYFTDGDGIFPEKPDYETAFVFIKKCEGMNQVPAWAEKLLIECEYPDRRYNVEI